MPWQVETCLVCRSLNVLDNYLLLLDANGMDLSQMDLWYSQAGTPIVTVEKQEYDPVAKTFTLTVSQRTPTTPGPNQREEEKKPMMIPLITGLIDPTSGAEILASQTLVLKEKRQTFSFENIDKKPVLSILRDFSAPVNLEMEQSDDELLTLMAHDSDSFNCWEASHRYWSKYILQLSNQLKEYQGENKGEVLKEATLPDRFIHALRTLLKSGKNHSKDKSLVAYALQIPDEATLSNAVKEIDIDSLYHARKYVKEYIAKQLSAEFREVYDALSEGSGKDRAYEFTPAEVGRRRLRNTCLDYVASLYDVKESESSGNNAAIVGLVKRQFDEANCMTDKISALVQLASIPSQARAEALETFYREANGNALVINKWFSIQATADYPNLLTDVERLKQHPDFTLTNPNRARSLLSIFGANLHHFHQKNGEGYRFLADAIIELDRINPQVAARMISPFSLWRRYDTTRQELMKSELERIQQTSNLSPDSYEIVSRYLK